MMWKYVKNLGKEEINALRELDAYAQKIKWRTRYEDGVENHMVEEAYCFALGPKDFAAHLGGASALFNNWLTETIQKEDSRVRNIPVCRLDTLYNLELLGLLRVEAVEKSRGHKGYGSFPVPMRNGTVIFDADGRNPPIMMGGSKRMPRPYSHSLYRAFFTDEGKQFLRGRLIWVLSRFTLKTNLALIWAFVSIPASYEVVALCKDWADWHPHSWWLLIPAMVVFAVGILRKTD